MYKIIKYSEKIKNELISLLNEKLSLYRQNMAIAVTGSLSKYQLTPKSDIDLIIVTNDQMNPQKKVVVNNLKNSNFQHKFEFYSVQTIKCWENIASYSAIFGSDIFFAQTIWGNKKIFNCLQKYLIENHICLSNQFSYFIYNLLYRDEQIKDNVKSENLKYQPGGLRDMQFLVWVSKRLGKKHIVDHRLYLKSLVDLGFISKNSYKLLVIYFYSILDYKWELELNKNSKSLRTYKKTYDQLRSSAAEIIETVKKKILLDFSKTKGKKWLKYVTDARKNKLDLKTRWSLIKSGDESLIFCGLWKTKDKKLINYAVDNLNYYWTARASIALNIYTDFHCLKKLYKKSLPDMSDIRMFIKKNPNFKT